jgi:hypothetical protein
MDSAGTTSCYLSADAVLPPNLPVHTSVIINIITDLDQSEGRIWECENNSKRVSEKIKASL